MTAAVVDGSEFLLECPRKEFPTSRPRGSLDSQRRCFEVLDSYCSHAERILSTAVLNQPERPMHSHSLNELNLARKNQVRMLRLLEWCRCGVDADLPDNEHC